MIGRIAEVPGQYRVNLRDFYNHINARICVLKNPTPSNSLEDLERKLIPWDILIIRRSTDRRRFWPALLKLTWATYTHVLMVTESRPLKVVHATENKVTWAWSWIEEIDFLEYARQHRHIEIVSVRTTHNNSILNYVKNLIWGKYDKSAAIFTTLLWINRSPKGWRNCVELVAEALYETLGEERSLFAAKKLKNTARPDALLKLLLTWMNFGVKSVYCTSLKKVNTAT